MRYKKISRFILTIDIRSHGRNSFIKRFYCPPHLNIKEQYWRDLSFKDQGLIYHSFHSIGEVLPDLLDEWED